MNRMFNTHHILTERKLFLLHESTISLLKNQFVVTENLREKNNSSNLPESRLSLFFSVSNCLCQTMSKRSNELIIVQKSKAIHSCLPFLINLGA